jgi:hypothetical protein
VSSGTHQSLTLISLVLAQVCTTLEELLDIGSALYSIDQLHQPRVLLEFLSPVLNEVFIVQQLEENQISIFDLGPNNIRPATGKI